MITSNAKIIKSGGAEPGTFEASISQALLELETNSDLKSQLRELYIKRNWYQQQKSKFSWTIITVIFLFNFLYKSNRFPA